MQKTEAPTGIKPAEPLLPYIPKGIKKLKNNKPSSGIKLIILNDSSTYN